MPTVRNIRSLRPSGFYAYAFLGVRVAQIITLAVITGLAGNFIFITTRGQPSPPANLIVILLLVSVTIPLSSPHQPRPEQMTNEPDFEDECGLGMDSVLLDGVQPAIPRLRENLVCRRGDYRPLRRHNRPPQSANGQGQLCSCGAKREIRSHHATRKLFREDRVPQRRESRLPEALRGVDPTDRGVRFVCAECVVGGVFGFGGEAIDEGDVCPGKRRCGYLCSEAKHR